MFDNIKVFKNKKFYKNFEAIKFFFSVQGVKNPGSGSRSALRKNAGSGSALKLMRLQNTGVGDTNFFSETDLTFQII
jgi:hypothetical protein